MPRRRVLLVAQALTQGGSERQLAATAMALDRARFEPAVAVLRAGGFREEDLREAGVPVHVFPCRSFKRDWLPQLIAMTRFIRRERFNVIHSFDTPGNLLAVAAGRLAGAQLVLSSQRAHRDLSTGWLRPALRLTDRLAHGVVVNCRFLIDHLTRNEGVPARKIHLVYNGLDTTHFRAAGPRATLPFPAGSLVAGVVCALRPEKDLRVLVTAFAQAASSIPRARLLIVGSGPELPALQRQASELGLGARVHFEPSVRDTAFWLRVIDIFALPSHSEAFSNSLMEAMACGAVPVASDVGGNPELVTSERGFVFPVGDAGTLAQHLTYLFQQEELRQRLAAQAMHWVAAELNWSVMAQAMGRIYEAGSWP